MSIWQKIKHVFAENQIMVVLIGIIAGILLPRYFRPIAPYGTYLLMLIFFTSSLRLNLKELLGYAKDWKMLAMATGFMLVFLPLAMWFPPAVFSPDWALAFLIMGAMPTGMTIALIADLFGGKTSLALVVTAVTSLLAPITIPLVFWLAIGRVVPVPVFSLFANLFITIVIPFILAALLQRKAPKIVKKYDSIWRNVAVWTFGILIAAIVSDTTSQGPIVLSARDIGLIIVMLIYIGGLTALAFVMAWWRSNAEKATLALCMVYLNNTLALYIANRYFPSSRLMTQLVIILLVINVLLPPFRWIAAYAVHLDKLKTKKRLTR
jgi:BASS family bile acid:Na+ symporter